MSLITTTLPSIDELLSKIFTFSEREQELEADMMNKLNDVIPNLPMMNRSSEEEITHYRYCTLSIVRYYIHEFSRDNGEVFIIPATSINIITGDSIVLILGTKHVYTFFDVVYNHMCRNLVEFGLFTEYWEPIRGSLLISSKRFDDALFYSLTDTNEFQSLLDRTFEANRIETMNKKFNTNHNWKIHFNPLKEPVKRTEENKECLLCYEQADFICANCKYPLCSVCIEHLKHSTATCPSCQKHPLNLIRIEGGKWNIEEDATGDIMPRDEEIDEILAQPINEYEDVVTPPATNHENENEHNEHNEEETNTNEHVINNSDDNEEETNTNEHDETFNQSLPSTPQITPDNEHIITDNNNSSEIDFRQHIPNPSSVEEFPEEEIIDIIDLLPNH